MDPSISPELYVNKGKKYRKFLFGFILIALVFVFLYMFFLNSPNGTNPYHSQLLSHTHKIQTIPQTASDFLKVANLSSGYTLANNEEIIKTQDNRFWFFQVVKEGCVEFCNLKGYMIDTQNDTISQINVVSTTYDVTPIQGSIVFINHLLGYDNSIIYDPSQDKVLDEMTKMNDVGPRHFLFLSDKYYLYIQDGIVYSRDISQHVSTAIGHFYLTNTDNGTMPAGDYSLVATNTDGSAYILLFVNPQTTNFPVTYINSSQNDPVSLIKWNPEDNSKVQVTNQAFNYPFYFRKLGPNSLFIGGGRDNNLGLLTYPSYIVNTNTGVSKKIYYGPTNKIIFDDQKQTITIIGSNTKDSSTDDVTTVFDFNGNTISTTGKYTGPTDGPDNTYPSF